MTAKYLPMTPFTRKQMTAATSSGIRAITSNRSSPPIRPLETKNTSPLFSTAASPS
jgi:hypothetical protein